MDTALLLSEECICSALVGRLWTLMHNVRSLNTHHFDTLSIFCQKFYARTKRPVYEIRACRLNSEASKDTTYMVLTL